MAGGSDPGASSDPAEGPGPVKDEVTISSSGMRRIASAARLVEPGALCLGRYRMGRLIGRGGYADVYQGVRVEDGLPVALKILATLPDGSNQRSRDRMLVEGHLALDLQHPNLVRYLDVGEEAGVLCLVMEFVDGGDAERLPRLHHGQVPAGIIARIGRDAARGLQALHDRDLLHRDVKPANLLLDAQGNCKVGDFGLLRPMQDAGSMTIDGNVVGTPAYIAPEQARSTRGSDHRADIYGLGASLHHLATGHPPHDHSNIWATLTSLVSDPFPDPRSLREDLPDDLARIIMKAGDKDPDKRYPTAAAMADDLAGFLAGIPLPQRTSQRIKRPVGAASTGPAVLLVDDDPLVRRLYAGRLKLDGFHIETAATVTEALESARRHRPAVVVLDLVLDPHLGQEDGTSALKRLRLLPGLESVPVLLFSNALAADARLKQVRDLGVTRILAKAATSPRELSLLLQEMLGFQAPAQEVPTDRQPATELDGVALIALAHLQAVLPGLGGNAPADSQAGILRGIVQTARGLSAAAAACGRLAMAAAAESTEHLARRLADDAEPITPSLHRTLSQAVTCLQSLALCPRLPGQPVWKPGKILVVVDDALASRYATKALTKANLPVVGAHHPADALMLLADHDFALLICDASLPDMSGEELVRRFRSHSRHRDLPIIFVTTTDGSTHRLADDSEADVISKPYLMAELAVKALVSCNLKVLNNIGWRPYMLHANRGTPCQTDQPNGR